MIPFAYISYETFENNTPCDTTSVYCMVVKKKTFPVFIAECFEKLVRSRQNNEHNIKEDLLPCVIFIFHMIRYGWPKVVEDS